MKPERLEIKYSDTNLELGKGINRGSDWWSNIDNNPANPDLMMAKALQNRGLRVDYMPAVSNDGRPIPSMVAIHADSETKKLLWRISDTKEHRALSDIYDSYSSAYDHIEQTSWDPVMRIRARATYHEYLAAQYRSWNTSGDNYYAENIAKEEAKMRDLLGDDLKVLDDAEMTRLVEQTVDRVLTASQSSPNPNP